MTVGLITVTNCLITVYIFLRLKERTVHCQPPVSEERVMCLFYLLFLCDKCVYLSLINGCFLVSCLYGVWCVNTGIVMITVVEGGRERGGR